jgi:hypothetical protein
MDSNTDVFMEPSHHIDDFSDLSLTDDEYALLTRESVFLIGENRGLIISSDQPKD